MRIPSFVATKLPSFRESLAGDLRKYGEEKAWHDEWVRLGRKNTVSLGDRAALVGTAFVRGMGGGILRGAGELAISLAIQEGGKKIPYLSGFVEIAQIAFDPKGWFQANKAATWDKIGKSWADIFGAGKDWVTRVEGVINLLDGVANVIGLLGTVCQVIAAVLFGFGLLFPALLSAAPFLAKAGFLLGEISSLIKLGVMGLRPFLVATRALQILVDGDADPATLAARAESLEKNTEEWTKEFTKAKGNKLLNKMRSSGKDAGKGAGTAKPKTGAKQPGSPTIAKPEKPKGFGERIKSLASKVANSKVARGIKWAAVKAADSKVAHWATGGQGPEFRKKWQNIEDAWNTPFRSFGLRVGQKERELEEAKAKVTKAERRYHEANEEASYAQKRVKAAETALNSKKTFTVSERLEDEEAYRRAKAYAERAEQGKSVAATELDRARDDLVPVQGELAEAKRIEKMSTKPVLGNLAKGWVKSGSHLTRDWLVKQGSKIGLWASNEEEWREKEEAKLAPEMTERRRKKVEELQAQYISIPSKLPGPPVEDEKVVDEKAARYNKLGDEIVQIAFGMEKLKKMNEDAEVEKTGLDVLNKLALANREKTEALKEESKEKEAAIDKSAKHARAMEQSSKKVTGPGAEASEFVPFLAKLANLLGMVPSKMAPDAKKGVGGAQQVGTALQKFGQTAPQTERASKAATDLTSKQRKVVDESNQKIANAEVRQQQLMAEQLAAKAELMEGKAFIQQGIGLAEKKKKEKEEERAKAEAEYLAAKKRLLDWAIMHEQVRKGEEASLETSIKEAEQMLSRSA